ncbi:beta-lactamase family protein [Zunongwangia sp. SCSIO 43204]|uniref:serine hydrolase domain-containing protein n=1 Tax=Zunongwangia sp. SCSIO 43204 TaxID=2779359 RepID=UPI001CA8C4A7|nr:serine hydrolase domain-containing protein [Zunongwangia sp. SCSIO 43204]UAB83237.1 beta-lactamase family protein [Zunongwangia sp. SCSIO 43204]
MSSKKSKTIIRVVLAIGTITSLFFVPWIILKASLMPLPDTVQEQVNRATGLGFDGIIVYVDKKGNEPEFFAAGYKNKEEKIPADPHYIFKIASVSKLYHAVAIAKLVRENQLSLDKNLADYLPELKGRIENAEAITLRMMVQHRSGIPNYTDTYMYWAAPKETAEENLALVLDQLANFAPGTDYEYSNTNYLLIDRIIQRVLGYDTFDYIQAKILDPLQLKNTYASIQDVDIDDVMSGYYVGYEGDLKYDNIDVMLATAEDLGKFIRALNDGSVFKDEKEQEIYSSIYRYEHTGLIPGYQSIAKYHKDIDTVVIQFTNTVDFEGYNWSLHEIIYNRLIKILKKNNS